MTLYIPDSWDTPATTDELIRRLQTIAKEIRALPGGDAHGKRSQAETNVYGAIAMLNDLAALQQPQPTTSPPPAPWWSIR